MFSVTVEPGSASTTPVANPKPVEVWPRDKNSWVPAARTNGTAASEDERSANYKQCSSPSGGGVQAMVKVC